MGIYDMNHFNNREEAVKYYAKHAKNYAEYASRFLERKEPIQAESALAKANIFLAYLLKALEHDFEEASL